ncbi:MAG: PSD1 and planctomycete cytochrome C domain-containing protein [Planctomycetota bacterium]
MGSLCAGVLAALVGAAQEPSADAEGVEFFERRVRPILAARCFECHSAAAPKLKGQLRLDTSEGVRRGGPRRPAVRAGDPERSPLIQAVRWTDEDLRMPPRKKLPDREIADLEAWVLRGAPLPPGRAPSEPAGSGSAEVRDHWAFRPLGDPAPPGVRNETSVATPVDRFLLARLEEKGLSFSPPADKRTLLRRVSFDLTGLPPTPEEMDAFLADASPDAFAKVVDRLLASPHYGERWGRHWLDVARYADTKGYVYADREEARFVHAHAYRDWVLRAFNEDLPFDRFLMYQIAADRLVGEGERHHLAAMGFLTVGRRFINNIHDIIDDRIDTLSRGILGLTVSCARCHDHKYDPIPTADYYSLYGIFASSAEMLVRLPGDPERPSEREAFERELRRREEALETLFRRKREELFERLRAQTGMYLAAAAEVEKLPTEEFYQLLGPDEVNPVIARRWHAYIASRGKAFDPIFAPWNVGASVPKPEFSSRMAAWLAENAARLNPRVAAALGGVPLASLREVAERYGRLLAGIHRKWKEAEKRKAERLEDDAEEELRRVLYGPDSPIALPTGAISEVEWFFDEATRVELGKAQRAIDQLLIDHKGAPPYASILVDRPVPYEPRIFRRGNPATKGEEVPRRFLAILSGGRREPFRDGSGRLELAGAIAHPSNPLTARVWVNRVWLHHFGRPLVATPSDFGLRSDPPTHPELLDWLARRFVEGSWSTKNLHRLIVLSNAYRQSSADNPEARRVDPENRLLWRMNRRRLDFEAMRDACLAAGGRLDRRMGGRPVDLVRPPSSRRRAVYGFVDRLNIPGVMRAFDFVGVDAHSPLRAQTTTPQQALFLMNSPFIAEQARALAARPEVTRAADAAGRVRALYRLLFAREPSADEFALGARFLETPLLEAVPLRVTAWAYGWGEVDEGAGRLAAFHPLPYFTGTAWQGGPDLPDPETGWVYLTAQGGHPGNDRRFAAVRRWTAPADGTLSISGTLAHKAKGGDGVRARILSSRSGELASWTVCRLEAETRIRGVEVRRGDTIDFVVDCRTGPADDEFTWSPVLRRDAASGSGTGPVAEAPAPEWKAAAEFAGPPPPVLTPLEKYAQALLLTNEFMFVD